MKTPKYIDKHAGRVKDFGKTLEEEYPKVTPIDEFRKMFTVRDDDSAFSDDADCSFRESVLKKLTKTIESERERYLKGFIKLGYGKRCKEYEEGCPTCDEWKLFDEYINKLKK